MLLTQRVRLRVNRAVSDIILEVNKLSIEFSTNDGIIKAVNDVHLSLKKGEVLGLVGESGSGKSVTVMSLLRLLPKHSARSEGQVLFQGRDLLQLKDKELQQVRGNQISMIFQDPMTSLNPYMRVSNQITETMQVHQKVRRKEARARCLELLRAVGIKNAEKRMDSYPHEFSGGMRQRVMIAMALACNPDIIIADEPTTALDVSVQVQILDVLKDLAKRFGTAVIFITHDLSVVANMCDRVAVMYAGRIIETAAVEKLFTAPSHPYTQGLLDSVMQLYQKGSGDLRIIEGQPPILIDMPDACLFFPRCKYVEPICRRKRPYMRLLSQARDLAAHYAACWRLQGYRDEGPRDEGPWEEGPRDEGSKGQEV